MLNNKLLILDGTSLVNDAYNSTLTKEVEEANKLYANAKTVEERESALLVKNEAYKTLLKSTSGEFINAVQEFFKDFLEILDKQNPSHVAVVWGTSRKTNYKREIFSGYKNDNKEMDEPLRQQFYAIKRILKEIGTAQYRSDKYEALDIAGSIAKKFNNTLPTCIVARNKNALQLCTDSTVWLKTHNRDKFIEQYNLDLSNVADKFIDYDEHRVKFIHELTPNEFVDFRALVGIPSSGIPGAKGIGEARALPLIKHFGSIEAMYKKLKEIQEEDKNNPKEKILKKYTDYLRETAGIKRLPLASLLESEENAIISKKLVSIKTDILLEEKELEVNIDKIILAKEMKRYDLANVEIVNDDSCISSSSFRGLMRTFNPTIFSPASEEYIGVTTLDSYINANFKDTSNQEDVNEMAESNDNSISHNSISVVTLHSSNTDYDKHYIIDDYYDEEEYDEEEYDEEEHDEHHYEGVSDANGVAVIISSLHKEIGEVSFNSEQTTIDELINKNNAFTILEVVTAYKYQCNHCNEYFTTEGKPAKFCPHCGTKNNVEDIEIPIIEKSKCNLSDMKVK